MSFRELENPVGMEGDHYKVNQILEKFKDPDNFEGSSYYYGTHYSSPMLILHYLIRISPFTAGAKDIQDGRFDNPDRIFHSMNVLCRNIREEVNDVREFIPEFYYLPEMYYNTN